MILNTNGFHTSEGVKLILILFWGNQYHAQPLSFLHVTKRCFSFAYLMRSLSPLDLAKNKANIFCIYARLCLYLQTKNSTT